MSYPLQAVLREAGFTDLESHPEVEGWATAGIGLLETGAEVGGVLRALSAARRARDGHRGSFLGPGARAAIERECSCAGIAIAARELHLEELAGLSPDDLRDAVLASTESAIAALEAMRDDTSFSRRVRRTFPELAALAVTGSSRLATNEHETAAVGDGEVERPLLDHLSVRVLGRKLRGLERADIGVFQRDESLSEEAFQEEVRRLDRVRSAGLLPTVRAALMYLDFAKGGTAEVRRQWEENFSADLSVHNLAAARILHLAAQGEGLEAFTHFRAQPVLRKLVIALVESHGVAGQVVRGETPMVFFAPWVQFLRGQAMNLADELGIDSRAARSLAQDCLHLVNLCDTAGVREGLLTDQLWADLRLVSDRSAGIAHTGEPRIKEALAQAELAVWLGEDGGRREGTGRRDRLQDRLSRLRGGRITAGEPASDVGRVLDALSGPALACLDRLISSCSFWYAESATGMLSAEAQIKVLSLGMVRAAAAHGVRPEDPFHVNLLPLVGPLSQDSSAPYRVRLLEARMASRSLEDILGAGVGAEEDGALLSWESRVGSAAAVELAFRESDEARALIALLGIYETKSSAAFHSVLKALCDVYGLRKDEFDRVSNEQAYLATMNQARSDKQRMLDHVKEGLVLEVGPGGGVVLDLIEERFPGSEVVGLDASHMAVQALRERAAREGRRWRVVEGDAFRMPELFEAGSVDTVLYCSVLHEIFSYVEFPVDGGAESCERFRIESVRDLLKATYRCLRPGGRIIIRDGVMPEAGERVLEFVAPDAKEFFELFVREFEGRNVRTEWLDERRVRLGSADAMEFLYTYTWGPESFPYEVREQYGVLSYDEYRARILEWLGEDATDYPPRALDLPEAETSYLQEGYRTGLEGKVRLWTTDGEPAELPDSNALWVIEKGQQDV